MADKINTTYQANLAKVPSPASGGNDKQVIDGLPKGETGVLGTKVMEDITPSKAPISTPFNPAYNGSK
jgi:hypothetical protein